MESLETINVETIEESVQSEVPVSESVEEAFTEATEEVLESETELVETGNESAQTTETMVDYSEILTFVYSEIQSVNYLLTVMVFLQLFIWVESKVNHIVRSVSNKWKV